MNQSDDKIKTHWDTRALDPGLDPVQVTHPDTWQRWLEIETIKRFVPTGSRIVDLGCGAGSLVLELSKDAKEAVGLDFSGPMIDRANAAAANTPGSHSFRVGNVLDLPVNELGQFDVALSVRCLINLEGWDDQKQALDNIAKLVRPGGLYLFVEGSQNGRKQLNEMRQQVGLEAMPPVWHNCDFDREQTLEHLSRNFTLEQEVGFGAYDLIARVVHPLYVAPDQPKYDHDLNRIAAKVALARPQECDLSRVLFFVLRRNS